MIGFSTPVQNLLEQVLDNIYNASDEALEKLHEGRTLPAIRQVQTIKALSGMFGPFAADHLQYRINGLNAATERVLGTLEEQFDLTLFPHPLFNEIVPQPRADIYVPGKNGYSVIMIGFPKTPALAACDFCVRDVGPLSMRELSQTAMHVLNVTGGLLSKRGQDLTAPIMGYDVAETLAPIVAIKYLRRLTKD